MKNKITPRFSAILNILRNNIKKASKKIKLFLFFVLITASSFAQNVKGFYVNGFNSILGNTTSENTLLNYARDNGYNYLCLYSLGSLDLTSSSVKTKLAGFISRAKTEYGIIQVGAAGEIYSFFSNYIIPYNQGRSSATEKFDVLNFEFEFWITSTITGQYCSQYLTPGGFSCDTAGAFAFAKTQFSQIDNAAAANGMISEVYFGWPNKGQMQWYAQRADRILVHAYRTSDSDIYSYTKNRLIDIASMNIPVKVIIIFSSESSFMGPWLNSHPITQPYTTYAAAFAAETGSWKNYISLQGYQWFKYSTMPATTAPVTASITAGGPVTFCPGGSVVLTANSGTSQTYQWTKNSVNISGETNTICTATSAGIYAVKVSKGGVTATSSSITVSVSANLPQPVISANGPLSFCNGGNVKLTSSSTTGNRWSNNATTQSITVSSAGTYSVTVTSGSCSATSAMTTVTTGSSLQAPTISASGALSFCPGGNVTLTSSSATGNLWSNNSTAQSIVVSAAGDYNVKVTSGECSATSEMTTVSTSNAPSTPTITVNGSTKICPGSGVVLTSSIASSGGYTWSTGETTRSIIADAAGSYWVRIGITSCYAQSSGKSITLKSAPTTPVITASGSTNLGEGGSVKLTSSSAYTYSWVDGSTTGSINVSTAGNYRVTVSKKNGCSATSAYKVVTSSTCTPPPVPSITSTSSNNVLEEGASLTLKASPSGGYLWSNGETTQSITVSTAGTFTVRSYNAGYCYSTSMPVTIYMATTLARYFNEPAEETGISAVTLYPNPAKEVFHITFNSVQEEICQLNIYDLSGRIAVTKNITVTEGNNTIDLNAGSLKAGLYVVLLNGEHTNAQLRLTVTQ